jgi:hypothetical protein
MAAPRPIAIRYLLYLRDVSRHIVRNAGLENVLPKRTRTQVSFFRPVAEETAYALLTHRQPLPCANNEHAFWDDVKHYLAANPGKELFLGLGLVSGRDATVQSKAMLNAPCCYLPVQLHATDDGRPCISADADQLLLNLDLVSRFLGLLYDADNEEAQPQLPPQTLRTLQALDELEQQLARTPPRNEMDLRTLWQALRTIVPERLHAVGVGGEPFDASARGDQKKLTYYPQFFWFVHTVPGELSAYVALEAMAQAVGTGNELHHPRLAQLLVHLLQGAEYSNAMDAPVPAAAIDAVVQRLPVNLSPRQQQIVQEVWHNRLTYVEGPPGTGKSHTIRALMLAAAQLGQSILLVSHKAAALQVVKEGLDALLVPAAVLYVTEDGRQQTRDQLERDLETAKQYDVPRHATGLAQQADAVAQLLAETQSLQSEIDAQVEVARHHYHCHQTWLQHAAALGNDLARKGIPPPDPQLRNGKPLPPAQRHAKAHALLQRIYSGGSFQRKHLLAHHAILRWYRQKLGMPPALVIGERYHRWAVQFYEFDAARAHAQQAAAQLNADRLDSLRTQLAGKQAALNKRLPEWAAQAFAQNRFGRLAQKPWGANAHRAAADEYRKALRKQQADGVRQAWRQIAFGELLQTYPLWCANLRELNRALPLQPELFDLVVVDEASQVNLAEILPALYRGKRWVIVGDEKQLHLNATGLPFMLRKSYDGLSWQRNDLHIDIPLEEARRRRLMVSDASILALLRATDLVDLYPRHVLNEHYRSLPHLAHYTNSHFYAGELAVMQDRPDHLQLPCFAAIACGGTREKNAKVVPTEVARALQIVAAIIRQDNTNTDAAPVLQRMGNGSLPTRPLLGIISILSEQRDALREQAEALLSPGEQEAHALLIGTPEDFQGNERDVVFITLGTGDDTEAGVAHYQNPNRMNVATSRARHFAYLLYGGLPQKLAAWHNYSAYFGTSAATHQWPAWQPANAKGVEQLIGNLLAEYARETGVDLFANVQAAGQTGLDFVLFSAATRKTVAVLLQGPARFYTGAAALAAGYALAHHRRVEVLQRAGWQVVYVPYHAWHDGLALLGAAHPQYIREKHSLWRDVSAALN